MQRKLTKTAVNKVLKAISFDPNKQPILAKLYNNMDHDYVVKRAYEELSLMTHKQLSGAELQEVLCATARLLLVAMHKNGELLNGPVQTESQSEQVP